MIQPELAMAVKPSVDPQYFLKEYDDILMGRRRTYSSSLMAKEQGPRMCAELLRCIFELYYHWSPADVRDKLTAERVKTMRITPLVKRIPCPPEVNASKELYYVAWYLYPETRTVKTPELILKLYQDILDDKIKKFPSNYFDGNDGYIRARILFLTMVREFLPPFTSLEAMYAFFASPEGRACITKYKLSIPLRELYGSALAYLHDALPECQKDEWLYEKYNTIESRRESLYLPVTEAEKKMLEYGSNEETGVEYIVEEEYEEIEEGVIL